MKRWFFIIIIPLIFGCLSMADGWAELDLSSFKISVPKEWHYKKVQGEDSFVGEINGSNVSIHFDFSNSGYANSLIPTEQEYIKKGEWNKGYFYKDGVTYTADFNVKNERGAQMKKLGTTDSTLVHVEADPRYQTKINTHVPTPIQKIKFPKADYIADLTFKDSTISVPIEIPIAIKYHNIQIDTTDKYIIKTIWPKVPAKGMTGIYFKGRFSHLTFNMLGSNLSKQDQGLALKAFKSIIIK
jgi:hypothetical protein